MEVPIKKDEWDISMNSYNLGYKMTLIKFISKLLDTSLMDAKSIVEKQPLQFGLCVPISEAREIKEKLEKITPFMGHGFRYDIVVTDRQLYRERKLSKLLGNE